MATYEQNYDLVIAVDEGFNSGKIVINGLIFEIPTEMLKTDGESKYIGDRKGKNYIGVKIQNTNYIVGSDARILLTDNKTKQENAATFAERESFDFLTSLKGERFLTTCIGIALIKYSEYCNEKNLTPKLDFSNAVTKEGKNARRLTINEGSQWNIWLIVGYPHEYVEKITREMKPRIAGRKQLEIENNNKTYELDFLIKATNIMSYSQAQAAFMGCATDDQGNWLKAQKGDSPFSHLPCLVYDGGQKTAGIYEIDETKQIRHQESNTDFAMNNIYAAVVEEIKAQGRDDIYINNIPEYLNGKKLNARTEDGHVKTIDIHSIFQDKINEFSNNLIEYLEEKFNYMLDLRSIIVAGGTGAAIYDNLKEYIDTYKDDDLKQNTHLTNYEFQGKKIEPKFAIAVGLYKILLHEVAAQKRLEKSNE